MAHNHVLAKRYSKALRLLVTSTDEAAKLLKPLQQVAAAINESKQLSDLLNSDAFSATEKQKVLKEVLSSADIKGTLSDYILKVVEFGRAPIIPQVAQYFTKLVHEEQGTLDVRVESAMELSKQQEDRLRVELERATGKKFLVHTVVNPQLLAGLRVELMGKTLDGSLRTLLATMKQGLLDKGA
jgi:F-type H+-transporting ATPase subunit delta